MVVARGWREGRMGSYLIETELVLQDKRSSEDGWLHNCDHT